MICRVGGVRVSPLPLEQQYGIGGRNSVNVAQIGSPSKVATVAGRCVDATGSGMVRAGAFGSMARKKEKNAPAHAPASTTAWANRSNAARYIAQHLSPYHTGARLSGRRYIPKCLHLAPNSWPLKHPATVGNIQHGAQLASQTPGRGERYKHAVTSERYKHAVTSKGEELARQGEGKELAAAGKGEELARRVSVTNTQPRVRVKNWQPRVRVKNPGRITPQNNPYSPVGNSGIGNHQDRLSDKGCLWDTRRTIRMPYMISDAYRSARNDKFCLYSTNVLLRMKIIFREAPFDLRPRYAPSRV